MTEKEEWKQTTNKGMQPCENLLAKSHNAHSCENPHKRYDHYPCTPHTLF